MLNLVRHNESSRKIVQEDQVLLLVSHSSELTNEDLKLLDGFVLDTESTESAYQILKKIRTHANLKIALKPVFIAGSYDLPKHVMVHTDGLLERSMINSYAHKVETIQKRIQSIHKPKMLSSDVAVHYKLLAFLYTRNIDLHPVHSRESMIGYEFPFVSLFYKKTEVISLLNLLHKATQKDHLTFQLLDHIHICKSCHGNYLNFRECCPKCESINIEAHDMVHHFVCAHVAPEKDFKTEDGLECPKCDKELRHIGIDYDKPSEVYSCNDCSHEFQNPGMTAVCMDCSTENKLEELLQKTIGKYSITQSGENFLFQKGIKYIFKEVDDYEDGNMTMAQFKMMLSHEIKRINSNRTNSIFASIQIKHDQFSIYNSAKKVVLKDEISAIIRSYLKDSDMLTSKGFDTHYILLPDTSEDNLERLELIDYNLKKLIRENSRNEHQTLEILYHKIRGEDTVQNFFL